MPTTKKSTPKPAPKATPKTASAKPGAKPTPKPIAPPPAPPAPKPASPEGKAAALGTDAGRALLELLKEAGTTEGAAGIAAKAQTLAKGERLTNAALIELKAAVNAVASALRQRKQDALARRFARANRSVRQLERATRQTK